MIFVFDLDDTVCDTDGYSEMYIKKFFVEHNMPYKKIKDVVRFAEEKFDWSKDAALCWYKDHGDEMMLNFPCKDGAIELINSLYDNGHDIIIATARATDWHSNPEGITKKWLNNNGIKYSSLYIGRIDKEKICEETNADVFIDDDIKITQRVAEYFKINNKQGKSYLMNTKYNKTLQAENDVIRVENFKEFGKKLVSNIICK